jgi:hypothetical protein
MADGGDGPCWCTALPAAAPLPAVNAADATAASCWCPACLREHIDELARTRTATPPDAAA